jgi:metal-responsive CopG/Arc/MetJ family transcriptional regulator
MAVKTFNVSFPKELADLIDEKAREQFGSRSDFLRVAAVQYLKREQKFQELMRYGKTLGENAGFKSEEEVADYFTNLRRAKEPWRTARKSSS